MTTRYSQERNKQIDKDIRAFLSHILPHADEEVSDLQAAHKYFLRSINNHQFLDVQWQEVERTVASLAEKYSITNSPHRGAALAAAFKKYQTVVSSSMGPEDQPFAIISVLCLLADCKLQLPESPPSYSGPQPPQVIRGRLPLSQPDSFNAKTLAVEPDEWLQEFGESVQAVDSDVDTDLDNGEGAEPEAGNFNKISNSTRLANLPANFDNHPPTRTDHRDPLVLAGSRLFQPEKLALPICTSSKSAIGPSGLVENFLSTLPERAWLAEDLRPSPSTNSTETIMRSFVASTSIPTRTFAAPAPNTASFPGPSPSCHFNFADPGRAASPDVLSPARPEEQEVGGELTAGIMSRDFGGQTTHIIIGR
jgi:hypothetical protein